MHENIVTKQKVEYIESQTYNNGCVDTDIIYHLGYIEHVDFN